MACEWCGGRQCVLASVRACVRAYVRACVRDMRMMSGGLSSVLR